MKKIYKLNLALAVILFAMANCAQAEETSARGNIFQKKTAVTSVSGQKPAAKTNVTPVVKPVKKAAEPKKPKIVRVDLMRPAELKIPAEYGSVKEYWPHASAPVTSPQSKIIIHIQDAHCNYEAQMNLAKMLEHLYLAYGNTLILVEGGSRSDSLSYMRDYAGEEKRIEVADKYLREGKICGENYLDITKNYPIDVFGIEKPELYDSNMNAFMKLDEIRDRDLILLDNLKQTADKLKEKLYSNETRDLEAKKKDYTNEKMKFKDYAIYLLTRFNENEKAALKKQSMENMILYDQALEAEKKTDIKKTELERTKLLDYLTKSLPPEKLKETLARTQQAKDEKIKQSQYYNYLKSLLPQGPAIAKIYPNLFAYIEYLNIFDKIDNDELFKELPLLEDTAYNKLIGRNKDAQQLYFISKGLETIGALIEIKITPDEAKFYTDNKNKFKVRDWKNFLSNQANRQSIDTNIDVNSAALDNHLAFVDSFYDVAKQREAAFVENSLKAMDARLPVSPLTGEAGAFKPKDPSAPKIAVLICGGYHTATLMDLFKKNELAYVVVAPNVTTATDKNLYRRVLKEVYTPMAGQQEAPVAPAKPVLPGMLRQQNNENKEK